MTFILIVIVLLVINDIWLRSMTPKGRKIVRRIEVIILLSIIFLVLCAVAFAFIMSKKYGN